MLASIAGYYESEIDQDEKQYTRKDENSKDNHIDTEYFRSTRDIKLESDNEEVKIFEIKG